MAKSKAAAVAKRPKKASHAKAMEIEVKPTELAPKPLAPAPVTTEEEADIGTIVYGRKKR